MNKTILLEETPNPKTHRAFMEQLEALTGYHIRKLCGGGTWNNGVYTAIAHGYVLEYSSHTNSYTLSTFLKES